MPKIRLGLLALTVTVLSWGGMFQAVKVVLATLDPYYLTVFRYGIAGSVLLLILFLTEGCGSLAELRRDPRRGWLFFYGTMGFAGFSLLTFEGLRSTSPQQAAVISNMQPLMTALVLWLIRGSRPARGTLVCVVVAFAGCVVVAGHGELGKLAQGGNVVGDLLVLAGAFSWVVYTLGAARFPDWSPLRYTALSCGLGTLSIFFIAALATWSGHAHVPSLVQLVGVFWYMLFIIVMSSVVAVLLWNVGVRAVGALNATLFATFVPVVVFAIGIFAGQRSTATEYLGAAMVIGAVVSNNLLARRALRLRLEKIRGA